jgi:type I restriction enzyme M protein
MADVSINEQANLIWNIADKGLRNNFKKGQYAHYIVPLVILKRFDSVLEDTKEKVLEVYESFSKRNVIPEIKEELLRDASGYNFYNTSKYDLNRLMDDPNNLRLNMIDYVRGFSPNVREIMENTKGLDIITKIGHMDDKNILYTVMDALNDPKINLHPSVVSNRDMGYVFEEIIRRFSEESNDDAGEHYTPREVIQLMTELLFYNKDITKPQDLTIYDPACGTGGMLSVAEETIKSYNSDSRVICFGQELNDETHAICIADMLIKGQDEKNIYCKNTLTDDQFVGMTFDYILCNPPFGTDWETEKIKVKEEASKGELGRFAAGLPPVSDGQILFLQTAIKKMKSPKDGGGKVAIIHNGSPLFAGDAGSGLSEIRRSILENDLLDAIIALPSNIFYNTGIPTFIWILDNCKPDDRKGKVLLINAHELYEKRRKPLGEKRNDISAEQIAMIAKAYGEFKNATYGEGDKICESMVLNSSNFGYLKVGIVVPELDPDGNPVKDKKGKKVYDKSKNDYESIPLEDLTIRPGSDVTEYPEVKQRIEKYLDEEVRPFIKYAEVDPKKITVGYKIPFSRYFYKFTPPRASDEIISEIAKLGETTEQLLHELIKSNKGRNDC